MDRIGQISNTLEKLRSRQVELSGNLAVLLRKKEGIINDLSLPDREMKTQVVAVDAQIESVESNLKKVESDLELWQRRYNAIIEAGRRELQVKMKEAWNSRQRKIYENLVKYNFLVDQLNSIRESIIALLIEPGPAPNFFDALDRHGAKMWRKDLLPRPTTKPPLEVAKAEICEMEKFS